MEGKERKREMKYKEGRQRNYCSGKGKEDD